MCGFRMEMYGAEIGVWVQDRDVWGRDWCVASGQICMGQRLVCGCVGSGWRCMGQRLVCGFRVGMYGAETDIWVQDGEAGLGNEAWVPGPVKICSHLPECQHLFVALTDD